VRVSHSTVSKGSFTSTGQNSGSIANPPARRRIPLRMVLARFAARFFETESSALAIGSAPSGCESSTGIHTGRLYFCTLGHYQRFDAFACGILEEVRAQVGPRPAATGKTSKKRGNNYM